MSVSGDLTFANVNDVTLDQLTGAIDLGASTVTNDLTLATTGAINQSGILTVGGNASFTASGAGNDITLNSFANDIAGTINFITGGTTTSDLFFDNGVTDIVLGASTVKGGMTLTTTGHLTVDGAVTTANTTQITADDLTFNSTLNAGYRQYHHHTL